MIRVGSHKRRHIGEVKLTIVTDAKDKEEARKNIVNWVATVLERYPYRMKGTRVLMSKFDDDVEEDISARRRR